VARHRLIWSEIPDRQYAELPPGLRALVDRRLAQLLEDPTGDADAVYDARTDQWTVPLGDAGFLLYALVRLPETVIVLRLVVNVVGMPLGLITRLLHPVLVSSRRYQPRWTPC